MLRKNTEVVRMRNYGRIIQDMVTIAAKETDTERQKAMIIYIAQCMRQKNSIWNKELESGIQRLQSDIQILSHGVLNCDFPEFEPTMQKLSLRPIATPDMKTAMQQKKKKK